MSDRVLSAKLQMPPLRPYVVARARLIRALNGVWSHRLTLVSAPAGYGKTTLARAWCEEQPDPVAWLALDAHDRQPAQFLRYVIHALRSFEPEAGAGVFSLLDAGRGVPLEQALIELCNGLPTAGANGCVLLDDFHLVDEPPLAHVLEFLLAHLPPRIHLLVLCRGQPQANLARLRAQGQLLEIGADDLRFTATEVDTFFSSTMQIELNQADRALLEMRTEGWIAGLQLAGLSLRGPVDRTAFIHAFSGTDRFIGDFLLEEVLAGLSESTRRFLVRTSIVDNLCAGLCDTLLEQTNGSQELLEELEARQMFVVPLDNQRHWFRYHALFADLLRHRLRHTEDIALIERLHRLASLWYAQEAELDAAVQHAILAHDYARAADLLEAVFRRRDWVQHDMARLVGWYEALPPSVATARPQLQVGRAWLALELNADPWFEIETYLLQAEGVLDKSESQTETAVATEQAHLRAEIDLLRANEARHHGDHTAVIQFCQSALARLDDNEMYLRGGAMAHLAAAHEQQGDLASAHALFAQSVTLCIRSGNLDGLLFAAVHLVELLLLQGELQRIHRLAAQIEPYVVERTGPDVGAFSIGVGEALRRQNRLEESRRSLEFGVERCRLFDAWQESLAHGIAQLADVLVGLEDLDAAQTLLWGDTGQRVSGLHVQLITCAQMRWYAATGELGPVQQWTAQVVAEAPSELPALAIEYREQTILTLAQVLLVQVRAGYKSDAAVQVAVSLLADLYQRATSAGQRGILVSVTLCQALLLQQSAEYDAALSKLQEAVLLSREQGNTRPFLDQGAPVYALLHRFVSSPWISTMRGHVASILEAFPTQIREQVARDGIGLDALTHREVEALRLLATERSIADIAAEMVVSTSTVRTYSKRIYDKLQVHSRAEAIYRARTLGLIP